MAEPTAYALGHLLTDLMGRAVTFKQMPAPAAGTGKQIFGLYLLMPEKTPIVVKSDLSLMGSFGGILVGLPDSAVKERLKSGVLDELLRDAVHEVLNVSATAVTTQGRAVFQKMTADPTCMDGASSAVLKRPDHKSYFDVSIDGYQGGRFYIFSPFAPVKVVNG